MNNSRYFEIVNEDENYLHLRGESGNFELNLSKQMISETAAMFKCSETHAIEALYEIYKESAEEGVVLPKSLLGTDS